MSRQPPRKGTWLSRFVTVDRGYLTPCDEWTGATTGGYGVVRIEGRKYRVHRLVWAMINGDPGALDVLHHCDNPRCARISHLFLGTAKVNMQDALAKGRTTQGERHANARLTADDIAFIRQMPWTGVALAERFSVSKQHISDIRTYKKWAHLP